MSERGFWLLMIAVGVAIPLGSELRRLLRSVRHPNEPPEPGRAYTLLLAAIGFAGLMATISTPLVYDEGPSASRMVAGPGMYPPKDFKAYGIVAFHTRPTGDDKSRFEIICNAYVSALLYYRDVKSPLEKQVVTVWPNNDDAEAKRINQDVKREKVCASAVPGYGLKLADDAIRGGRRNGLSLDGRGPFLIAWSPGAKRGMPDALILFMDMSDVINEEQAKQVFSWWKSRIEGDPTIWSHRYWEDYRIAVMLVADRWGDTIVKYIPKLG